MGIEMSVINDTGRGFSYNMQMEDDERMEPKLHKEFFASIEQKRKMLDGNYKGDPTPDPRAGNIFQNLMNEVRTEGMVTKRSSDTDFDVGAKVTVKWGGNDGPQVKFSGSASVKDKHGNTASLEVGQDDNGDLETSASCHHSSEDRDTDDRDSRAHDLR
jgi:hypothetical protein